MWLKSQITFQVSYYTSCWREECPSGQRMCPNWRSVFWKARTSSLLTSVRMLPALSEQYLLVGANCHILGANKHFTCSFVISCSQHLNDCSWVSNTTLSILALNQLAIFRGSGEADLNSRHESAPLASRSEVPSVPALVLSPARTWQWTNRRRRPGGPENAL